MDFNEAFDKILQDLGWSGTAAEFFAALKGPFNTDICQWLYGLGNSASQQEGALPINQEKRRVDEWLTKQWDEFKTNQPAQANEIDIEKLRRYAYECYLAGYAGEPVEGGDDDSTWMWWLLGLAGLGLGGYYLTRKK